MKIRVLVSLLLLFLACADVDAHLGDALPVVVAHLGMPTIPNGIDDDQAFYGRSCIVSRRYSFESGRYSIDVYIVSYLCTRIHYSKARSPNESYLSNASTWTDTEIQDLLKKNSEGKVWTELPSSRAAIGGLITRHWKRSDGGIASQASTELEFISPVYLQAVASARAACKAESEKVPNL